MAAVDSVSAGRPVDAASLAKSIALLEIAEAAIAKDKALKLAESARVGQGWMRRMGICRPRPLKRWGCVLASSKSRPALRDADH